MGNKEMSKNYNPGDSATNVQNPAGTLYLNHLLGSTGGQKYNAAAVSPTGMYSGVQQQGGQQQGGQQTRERRTDFSKAQNPNRGRPSRGNRSGASLGGISTQAPGGQQSAQNRIGSGRDFMQPSQQAYGQGGPSPQLSSGGSPQMGVSQGGRPGGVPQQLSSGSQQGGGWSANGVGPGQQGGGQQATNRMAYQTGGQGGGFSANGVGPGQQGGGQQANRQVNSAALSPMSANNAPGGFPMAPGNQPQGGQIDANGMLIPNEDYNFDGKSERDRFQPVDDNIFAQNADATGKIIRGEGVIGETDAQFAQRERTLNESLGGEARGRFDTTMSVNQPGMLTAMAGAQGGMGMGGYGEGGAPVSAFDADVGAAYNQQGGLEATGQQRLGAREAQGLQQAQNSQNQYTQDLMNNIDSAASSTLSNQLGSVGSQMEAAGLGRSGANGLASSRMGQQILGGAMRDKMNVLSQQTDRMSGQTFQGQQNRMGRMAASENEALSRMQNTGMGVTDAQTARLMNEEAVKSGARGENREQFALGDNVDRNARQDMLASEEGFRQTEQERQNSILAGQQDGVNKLGMLATGINQQPIDWRRGESNRQNPGVQLGGNVLQGAAQGYFSGGPDTFEQ